MQIYGLQKTTLLDYPGMVASTIFTGGCNLRCPFCHNMNIVENLNTEEMIPIDTIMNHLESRKGIIDAVCITGGEPTLQKDLADFIKDIKSLGYLVKLDSNGTNTAVIKSLMASDLLDYIAIDIKSSFNNYFEVCGLSESVNSNFDRNNLIKNIQDTISLLINQDKLKYEFRTTVIKEFHNQDTFNDIAAMLNGASNYYLQSFVNSAFVPNQGLHSYTKKELQDFIPKLSETISNVSIRGID